MSLDNILLMRQELLLTAAAIIVLIAEIFMDQAKKKSIITFSIVLFGIITASGFLPAAEGTLFGGMYVNSHFGW